MEHFSVWLQKVPVILGLELHQRILKHGEPI
jgi:hypothetical protein